MKKQRGPKKLTFTRETVRVLKRPELDQAAGGMGGPPTTWITCTMPSFPPFPCTTALSCGGTCYNCPTLDGCVSADPDCVIG